MAYWNLGDRYTNAKTTVIGLAVFLARSETDPSSSMYTIGLYDGEGDTGRQMNVRFEQNGVIRLYRGTTLVATTPANTYHLDEWNYLEIKCKPDQVDGLFELRVNTVTEISYPGDCYNGTPVLGLDPGFDAMMFGYDSSVGVSTFYIDDIYVLDDQDGGNVDYLGNVRVNTQLAVGAGASTQFSIFGSQPTNWQTIANKNIDDTQYVYDGTAGEKDLYVMDPNVVAQNIYGVQVRGAYRQDDATQMIARNLIRVGGTVYEGADHYLSGSYRYYTDLWEINPATGVGWTAADLNTNFQAGTKVQA
jgi:hypothetical protein